MNTFCFVLYYISHHPNVKKKMLEEIESVFRDEPTRRVTISDVEKLKYCEAIIKETSRIQPTASLTSRCIERPIEIAGREWPENTFFLLHTRGINNNPLYWKDPEKFIPERFYESENIENQRKNPYFTFGGGLRSCPGRTMAMLE